MEQQRLKVHRRKTFLEEQLFTVLSPRPDEGPHLSVSGDGDPVHINADRTGSALLGQLCWAMAYQRDAHTIAVVEPTTDLAVAVVNTDHGSPTPEWFEALAPLLPWTTPSDGTINLNTRSLESAVANEPAFYADQKKAGIGDIKHLSRFVKPVGGLLVLGAPAVVLKSWGVQLSSPDDARPKWLAVGDEPATESPATD